MTRFEPGLRLSPTGQLLIRGRVTRQRGDANGGEAGEAREGRIAPYISPSPSATTAATAPEILSFLLKNPMHATARTCTPALRWWGSLQNYGTQPFSLSAAMQPPHLAAHDASACVRRKNSRREPSILLCFMPRAL